MMIPKNTSITLVCSFLVLEINLESYKWCWTVEKNALSNHGCPWRLDRLKQSALGNRHCDVISMRLGASSTIISVIFVNQDSWNCWRNVNNTALTSCSDQVVWMEWYIKTQVNLMSSWATDSHSTTIVHIMIHWLG
jgi:hypothetical protein